MSMFNERLQILVRPDQRRRLENEARRRRTSVAALVREAVDAQFGTVSRQERLKAVADIRGMHAEFRSADELNHLVEQERQHELAKILRPNRT